MFDLFWATNSFIHQINIVSVHSRGQILDVSPPLCPQGVPKEVVAVSNMGVSKRGPIIEGRDRLLLEFTDGSVCVSDGLQLRYTTRIHLVCSKGSQVSLADRADSGF